MKRFQPATGNILLAYVVETNRHYLSDFSSFFTGLSAFKNCLVLLFSLYNYNIYAQSGSTSATDTAYQRVIAERTAKIVSTLNISDKEITAKVQVQIANQYIHLNAVHDASKANIAAIKAKLLSKEETTAAVKKEEENRSAQLKQLHVQFISQLKSVLREEQVEKVKDGMTYRILPVTWAAYLDMLQKLTQEQKDKMYGWLVEARELAMDEGSSDAKHAVFGKYKGRINNYLSAAGYDMKKEGEEWAKRIQAAKDAKQVQN